MSKLPHTTPELTRQTSPLKTSKPKQDIFTRFAGRVARIAGHSITFGCALGILLLWGVTGPIFHFNDTWQLVINTATTIVTFLMVFLIQNTQNRDSEALHLKLDELLRATKGAHTTLMELEDASQDELDDIKRQFSSIAEQSPDEDETSDEREEEQVQ